MIKEINIKNFQSHKDTKMSLHPGLNVIVGTSYSGKSAVLRALRWLVENKAPKGIYRSFWGGDTSIELVLDEHSATRGRTDKENTYSLDGEVLKAFKTDVPDPVKNLLNFNEINLQKQHDMPFLVSKSGPEIQRTLNEIANLDLIDTTMANLNGSKLKTSAEINDINEKLKSYEMKLKMLESVEQIKEKSISLKELYHMTQEESSRLESLLDTIIQVTNYKDQIRYWLKQVECYRNLQTIIDHTNTKKVKENKLEAILDVIENINSVTLRLANLNKSQERYSGLKALERQALDTGLKSSDAESKQFKKNALSDLISAIKNTKQALKVHTEENEKYCNLKNLEKLALDVHVKKTEVISKKSILEGIKYKEGQIKEVQGIIPKLEKIVEDSHIELEKLIVDKCPVCGTRKGEVRE